MHLHTLYGKDCFKNLKTKIDPITQCFTAVAYEAIRRPEEFKEQELKEVLCFFFRKQK